MCPWTNKFGNIKAANCFVKNHSLHEIASYDFKSTSHQFKFTSYEFNTARCEPKSTSYESNSTISWIIKLMKTEVNSLEISSFPKILSLKLIGNSLGNSYSQFLVINLCFNSRLGLQQKTKWVSHTYLKILQLISVTLSHVNDVIIVSSN